MNFIFKCLFLVVLFVVIIANGLFFIIKKLFPPPVEHPVEHPFLNSSVEVPVWDSPPLGWFHVYDSTSDDYGKYSYKKVDTLVKHITKGSKVTFFSHGACPRLKVSSSSSSSSSSSRGGKTWSDYLAVKNKLLNVDQEYRPDHIIMIDWLRYCDGTVPYALGDLFEFIHGFKQANQNSVRVAKELSHVIYQIVLKKRVNPANIHLIGYSLGGPLMGVAAWRMTNLFGMTMIGRITGIDPAYPKDFKDPTLCYTLDSSDARFVDIIHTDTRRFGQHQARAHVDFYVNNGYLQPGCKSKLSDISTVLEDICSHTRSFDLFLASMDNVCRFNGSHNCVPTLIEEGTESCQSGVRMGFYAIKTPLARGKYYIDTTSTYPYCKNEFMLDYVNPI